MNKFIAGRRYIASSPSSLMAPPLILIRLARTSRTSSNEIAAVILIRHSGALLRYTARSQSDMHCLPPAKKKKRREEKIYRTDSIKQERKRTFFFPPSAKRRRKKRDGEMIGSFGATSIELLLLRWFISVWTGWCTYFIFRYSREWSRRDGDPWRGGRQQEEEEEKQRWRWIGASSRMQQPFHPPWWRRWLAEDQANSSSSSTSQI